ncbi:MAG: hypothetical protein ABEJ28_05175 [Salinigranum sp.]
MRGALHEDDATKSEIYRILADGTRRRILASLSEEGTTTVPTLIAGITDGSNWGTTEVSLHHNHLPKMENAGLIAYDDAGDLGLTNLGERAESIRRCAVDVLRQ